ncbi:hypothetical protein LAZ67_23000456 [Cordylochernes scorpioides]|uniref:Uncharacterized protein n=1 Tax=Cordylochernes scorpioides TaxID=51811 RepID=A0ABY6LQ13_9ARAC|nr:hypothetical protein LAZ67_23000456 [Cordylochernes scorpioides]
MIFQNGCRVSPLCTKCNSQPATPRHIIDCIDSSIDELYSSPADTIKSLKLYKLDTLTLLHKGQFSFAKLPFLKFSNSPVRGHLSLKDTLALQLGVVLYREVLLYFIALMLNHLFHPVNQLCNSGVVPLSRRLFEPLVDPPGGHLSVAEGLRHNLVHGEVAAIFIQAILDLFKGYPPVCAHHFVDSSHG